MTTSLEIRDAWRLMRPGQWSILTAQFFLAVMLLSPRAAGGGCWLNPISLGMLAISWLVWVVLLNGGTLAFNSAHDRDTGPVAYLPSPPPPPAWLGSAAVVVMILGVILGWFVVGQAFGLVVAICTVLSILYSHPATRLKAKPGLDLLTNMVGYGAGTTLAGMLAGLAAYLGQPPGVCAVSDGGFFAVPVFELPALSGTIADQFGAALAGGRIWLAVGFGFLFGSFYPGTQIYQMEEDLARGDRTLVTALGVNRALLLAVVLGMLAGAAFLLAWLDGGVHWSAAMPLLSVTVWVVYLGRWWRQAGQLETAAHEKRMYTTLTLWALVDVAVLVGWLLRP